MTRLPRILYHLLPVGKENLAYDIKTTVTDKARCSCGSSAMVLPRPHCLQAAPSHWQGTQDTMRQACSYKTWDSSNRWLWLKDILSAWPSLSWTSAAVHDSSYPFLLPSSIPSLLSDLHDGLKTLPSVCSFPLYPSQAPTLCISITSNPLLDLLRGPELTQSLTIIYLLHSLGKELYQDWGMVGAYRDTGHSPLLFGSLSLNS